MARKRAIIPLFSALQLQHLIIFPTIVHHAPVYPCYAATVSAVESLMASQARALRFARHQGLSGCSEGQRQEGVKWPWAMRCWSVPVFSWCLLLGIQRLWLFGGKVYVGNSKMPSFLARCIMVQDCWCSVATTTVREASNKEAVHMFAAILWRCPTLRRFMCFSGCPLQALHKFHPECKYSTAWSMHASSSLLIDIIHAAKLQVTDPPQRSQKHTKTRQRVKISQHTRTDTNTHATDLAIYRAYLGPWVCIPWKTWRVRWFAEARCKGGDGWWA